MQIPPQQEEAGIIHSQKIKLFRAISPINYSENKTHKRQENEHELLQLDAHYFESSTNLALRNQHNTVNFVFFLCLSLY